jgi:hypothetical protein
VWQVFATWKIKEKRGACETYKGFFGGKNGSKLPYFLEELKKEKEKSHLDHLGSSMSQKYSWVSKKFYFPL